MPVVAIALSSCAREAPQGTLALRTDSAGVEIVTNSSADRPLAWRFERLLRIGGHDDGPQAFFQVPATGLAFDSRLVYVLDGGNQRIQVFDRSGAHVRTIGRRGRGPGELQYPSSFTVDRDGSYLVHDAGNRVLITFDAAGEYISQVSAPAAIFGPVRSVGSRLLYATRRAGPESTETIFSLNAVENQDTTSLTIANMPPARSLFYESCAVSISLPPLFANPPSWDASAEHIVTARWPWYEILFFSGTEKQRIIRRSVVPERATTQHALAHLGEGEEWLIGGAPCTVPAEEAVEKRGVADHVPALSRVAASPDGWVWAERTVLGAVRQPIDVFDSTGEYVGTLPPGSPWPAAFGSDGEFVALELDELDMPHVTLYRIVQD